MIIKHTVCASEDNTQLRSILRRTLCLSNTLLKGMKHTQNILVNGKPIRFIDRVHQGDVVSVLLEFGAEESTIEPEDVPIDILYEDDSIIALNKPVNMVIHPCSGHPDKTLGNALMGYFCSTNQQIKLRPLGRLDTNTTGIVLFAKNPYVQDFLIHQMKNRSYEKHYLGIIHGHLSPPAGEISLPIARKEGSIIERVIDPAGAQSLTLYETIQKYPEASLVRFQIVTGRTHQIRVHCMAVGHPLLGDTLYGKIPTMLIDRQALHSHTVTFTHPESGQRTTLTAPLPDDMQRVLSTMKTGISSEM
ncbi:MAG: RluA family pseudouridine synthase [Thermoclostridium sp.]|nr:RluA family pseudouridine synthase [Thermoclostridium sp.]